VRNYYTLGEKKKEKYVTETLIAERPKPVYSTTHWIELRERRRWLR